VHRSPLILIGNGTYVMSGLGSGRRDRSRNHRLSLYVVPRLGRLGALSLPMRALFGTLERDEQFESVSAKQITIAVPGGRVRAAIDGDPRELESPLRFAIKPGALQVI
jgi:diacylglycerol kinase family enzyme